ncbi:MAG: transcriptional repressor [Pirellulales bacterium]
MSKKLEQLEQTRGQLREAGLRATPARIALLEFLSKQTGPVSHQEACDALASSAIDKSTVFRALQDLGETGLVRRMELGDHVWRFELVGPGATADASGNGHPHHLCVDCGHITCLTASDVRINFSKSIGTIAEVLLRGTCPDCQASH